MYNVNASGSGLSGAAGQMGSGSGQMMAADGTWPSMQDLNTRLRRVITSYQRNYKKEELKQQQKAKVCCTLIYTISIAHSVFQFLVFFILRIYNFMVLDFLGIHLVS